jgi:hypothetical protein
MKKFLPLLLVFVSATATHAQSKADLKAEALTFSLKVVENYFSGDCEKGFVFFTNEIFTLELEGPFPIADKKEQFCNSFGQANRVEEKTFDDYLNDYQTSIQSLKKFMKPFKGEDITGFTIGKTDFVFKGFEEKRESVSNYLWDDMFLFVVRKVDGEWKIIGVSG